MTKLPLALLLATAAALSAQSPLTTLYQGSALLGAPTVYFNDFVVNVPIQITQIDVNSNSAFGTPGTLDVYYAPGSRVGIETNVSAWTLVATATVTSAGPNLPTVGTLNTAILLPPGNHTLAIQSNGISSYYTGTSGLNYSTAELTLLSGGGSANGALGTAICCQPRTWNGSIHYLPGGSGTVATNTSYGTGCPAAASGSTFYELFPNGTFDLSNTSLQLVPNGAGYVVLPGSNTWRTPTGTALPLADDSVSAAQALGFTLPYPGGATSAVYVSSNGFVWAQSSTDNGCCAGNAATLRTAGARWCPNWGDLNPSIGGTVQFDTDPANNAAYVTFTNVPEYGAAQNTNTFQVAFFATGVVEYRFQSCLQANRVVLTGWSAGANSSDPGSVDLSASLPILTGFERRPVGLSASARPIAGNSISLVTSNITSTAPFGATLLSLSQLNLDLTFLGMPGCYQYTGGDASLLFLAGGAPTYAQAITVPNLIGFHIYCQSAVFDPGAGATPLGVVSSNGVDLRIGNF
jgi:hypothetical protein